MTARKPSAAPTLSKAEARRRVAHQVHLAITAGLFEEWIVGECGADASAINDAVDELRSEMRRRATPTDREAGRRAR